MNRIDALRDEIDKLTEERRNIEDDMSLTYDETEALLLEIDTQIEYLRDELFPLEEQEQEEERMALCMSQGLSRFC
jgi:predicted  nucleic acid-binding Zn-ribbon protein